MAKIETGYPSIDLSHKKDISFFKNHPIIPNMSIYNALMLTSLNFKNYEAVDSLDLQASFDDLINDSAILSRSFKELGIKKGDIISVSMPNYYQSIVIFLAANRIGAITTFLNSFASIEEINDYLNKFESPLFVNFDKTLDYNKNIKDNTKVKQIITLYKKDLFSKSFNYDDKKYYGNTNFLSYSDSNALSRYYNDVIFTGYGSKTDSLILYTSGTTGKPKSVVLTNQNILAIGTYLKNMTNMSMNNHERCLAGVPFTYPYGFVTSTVLSLLCGRCVVLAPDLSSKNISKYLEKNPNIIFGSPAMLELIMRNTPRNQDLSSINSFLSGGDFLTEKNIQSGQQFFKDHNAVVEMINGSGNAETTGGSTNGYGIKNKPETVGKILAGTDAIIIDPDTGKELKYNEEGMLCISGKHVFKEYYQEPELTQDSKFIYKSKEYFKTGTLGKLSEDGFFTLTGRSSRFYIISTLNKVYCDHIQNIISTFDIVDSCAIVKKPDKDNLFTGKAFIVLKKGIKPIDEVKDYIINLCSQEVIVNGEKSQLRAYEIPTSIEFIDKLPRTKADKIDYKYLEDFAEEEYNREFNSNLEAKTLIYKKN